MDGDVKEATVLNRVIRWTENGLEAEADLRHAEIIGEMLEGSRSVQSRRRVRIM